MTAAVTVLKGAARNRYLLLFAGFNLILLNYTLIRTMTLAFHDLETSALLMALSYFTGISIGYLMSDRLRTPHLVRLLPVVLVFQLALASVGSPLVILLVRQFGTTLAYVLVYLLVTMGSTSVYSILLPRAIQTEAGSTRRYYALEVLGSLCGLAALPILGLGGMTLFYAAYLASFLALAVLLEVKTPTLVLMAGVSVLFLLGFGRIDSWSSERFYALRTPRLAGSKVVFTRYTPYHKIEVLEREGELSLYLNAHRQFGPSGHADYGYFAAEYPARLLGRPRVCVLGCGSMYTVGLIGDFVDSIRIVDIDRGVFETSKRFFPDYNRLSKLNNWTFESDDAKHFLATKNERFDLIIDDIPPARTRQVTLTYTREFFELVRARLKPGGIFSLPSLTPLDSNRQYGRRMLATMVDVFDQVLVLNWGDDSYYFGTDKTRSFDADAVYAAIDHPDRDEIDILMPEQARQTVQGATVITINNMADLMLQ